jgi:hypothetical protein
LSIAMGAAKRQDGGSSDARRQSSDGSGDAATTACETPALPTEHQTRCQQRPCRLRSEV